MIWSYVLCCSIAIAYLVLLADDAPESRIQVRYDVMELPITLPCQKPPADKPNPKQGIGMVEPGILFMFHKFPHTLYQQEYCIPLDEFDIKFSAC